MPRGIYIRTDKAKINMSLARKGIVFSEEHRKNIGIKSLSRKHTESSKLKISQALSGCKSPLWISDRSKLVKHDRRGDVSYCEWRKNVWIRDNYKCKINNGDCDGKIEAHHILPWRDFVELRYNINNGITLCHFHHPRKRVDEIRLSLYFKKLVEEVDIYGV